MGSGWGRRDRRAGRRLREDGRDGGAVWVHSFSGGGVLWFWSLVGEGRISSDHGRVGGRGTVDVVIPSRGKPRCPFRPSGSTAAVTYSKGPRDRGRHGKARRRQSLGMVVRQFFFFFLLRVLLSEDLSCQAARQKRAGRWARLTAGRIEWQFPSGCLHGRLSWRSRRLQARGWHYMKECAAVCRQTGRWASIEGGVAEATARCCLMSCPRQPDPALLGWYSPWALASVRLRDAAETDPTRPLLVELHQMLS